jgi:Raf kinase inhibitor-like YbhB/YbcL family protein
VLRIRRSEEQLHHLPGERDIIVEVESGSLLREETCEGAQYSPEIRLGGLIAPYIALILEDVNHSSGGLSHWLLWNVPKTDRIPRNIPKRGEFEIPVKGVQGKNERGEVGYSAICGPSTGDHAYVVRVYGLDGPLDLHPLSQRKDLEKIMTGHIIQYGQATIALPEQNKMKK